MKKIVGILAAASVMAAAIFAADVNAKVKVDGRLFGLNSSGGQYYGYSEGQIYALEIDHFSEGWNPDLSVSVSSDNAGASVSFFNGVNPPDKIIATNYAIWFKPIEALKVTVGQYATNLNQETIDWSNSGSGIDTQGYAVDFNMNGIFATLFFAPTWGKKWLTKEKDKDIALGEMYFKAGYGADFGRIQAMFRLIDTKNMWFGAAYDNTFGSVRMFVNALAGLNTDKGFAIEGEAFVTTNVDIVGLSLFVVGGYTMDAVPGGFPLYKLYSPVADKAVVGATFKATFALNGFTPYLYIKDANFLADKFGIEIKPGVTGSVGIMNWEVAVDVNLLAADKFQFRLDVPVNFSVAF